MKRNNSTLTLIMILAVMFSLTAVSSIVLLIINLDNAEKNQETFNKLEQIVNHTKDEVSEIRTDGILSEYSDLYHQNEDMYGWIRIDDTPIDYPVMYTPDDPEYYLRRAFDKSDSEYGTPFIDGASYEGCGNMIIYGHHTTNKTMFGTLYYYQDIDYWKQHPIIHFDSVKEHADYEIIATFYTKIFNDNEPGFRYYDYPDISTQTLFEEYITKVKESAMYDTGIDAQYGDDLITLSTCSFHVNNGRFVVVAKKIVK